LALLLLRDLGMGKIDLEPKILEEARALNDVIASHHGQPLDINQYMHKATCNIISGMVLGERHEYNDPAFSTVLDGLLKHASKVRAVMIATMTPFLQRLPGDPFGYHSYTKGDLQSQAHFREVIKKHADTLDEENPRDFIDLYLLHMKKLARSEQKTSLDGKNLIFLELFSLKLPQLYKQPYMPALNAD